MKRQPPKMPVVEVKKPGLPGLGERIAATLPSKAPSPPTVAKRATGERPSDGPPSNKKPPVPKAKAPAPASKPSGAKKKPVHATPPKTSFFYQALGWIVAPVGYDEGAEPHSYYVTWGGKRYELWVSPLGIKQLRRVSRGDFSQPLALRVYPHWILNRQGTLMRKFQLVGCRQPKPSDESRSGLFYLRGVWKQFPNYPVPLLTVFRNAPTPEAHNLPYSVRHLPILMPRSDGPEPFVVVFDPLKKDAEAVKWFIQGEFLFDGEEGVWRWVRDLEPPTRERPPKVERRKKRFLKPKASEAMAPPSV